MSLSPSNERADRGEAVNAIEVRGLVKRFGNFTAVDGVSFDVKEGEVFGLLGPNGAGKSTLIRMLTTLLVPDGGSALVGGSDITGDANGVRRAIGVIPQAMTSDLELTPEENLLIFAKLYGVPSAKRKPLIDGLLAAVELSQWADKPVKMLSGGMRRRVEIARGLVHEPQIFFLDEPTTGLDPVSRAAVWEMLRKIKAQRDLTVVLTTHYMDEADKLCDRIAIIDHGKVMALDSPLKLKASVSGTVTIDAGFKNAPSNWLEMLGARPATDKTPGDARLARIVTHDGPRTTMALLELSSRAGVLVESIAVQSTTLDDVFVHYTGRQLRDALVEPSPADRGFM